MKMKPFLMMLFVVAGVLRLGAEASPDSATVYFEEGEFEKAIAIWHEATDDYPVAGLYYNLGLAYGALGQRGNAIYSFEQALRLKPWSKRIQHALQSTREAMPDAVVPVNPFFLSTWYQYMLAFLRPGQWAFLGLVCIIAVVMHADHLREVIRIRPFIHGRWVRYCLITGVLLLIVAFLSYSRLAARHQAMIKEVCTLYQGATQESPVLRQLGVGEKVIITDEIGDWKYVQLANLDRGWLQQSCTQIIRLPGY